MRVLLLAGGYATRLMPLTEEMPKPLLKIKGKPAMDYVLEALGGIENRGIFVLTNKKFSNLFEEWGKGTKTPLKFIVENSTKESEKPGAIAAIANAIKRLGDDDYIVIAGDNVFAMKLGEVVEFFQTKRAPVIGVFDVGDRKLARIYSTVEMDEQGKIISMQEKPTEPKSTLIATCIYIFPKGTLKRFDEYISSGQKKDSPGYFIQWLSKRMETYGYPIRGKWFDIGTPETYERANSEI